MSFHSSSPSHDAASEISTLTSAPSGLLTPTIASDPGAVAAGTLNGEVPAIFRSQKKVRKSYVWNAENGREVIEDGRIKWCCNRCKAITSHPP